MITASDERGFEIISHLFVEGAGSFFAEVLKSRYDTSRLKNVMDHMKANFASEITISSLAELAGMGTSNFAHRYSEIAGMSPMKYLKAVRLNESDLVQDVGDPDGLGYKLLAAQEIEKLYKRGGRWLQAGESC